MFSASAAISDFKITTSSTASTEVDLKPYLNAAISEAIEDIAGSKLSAENLELAIQNITNNPARLIKIYFEKPYYAKSATSSNIENLVTQICTAKSTETKEVNTAYNGLIELLLYQVNDVDDVDDTLNVAAKTADIVIEIITSKHLNTFKKNPLSKTLYFQALKANFWATILNKKMTLETLTLQHKILNKYKVSDDSTDLLLPLNAINSTIKITQNMLIAGKESKTNPANLQNFASILCKLRLGFNRLKFSFYQDRSKHIDHLICIGENSDHLNYINIAICLSYSLMYQLNNHIKAMKIHSKSEAQLCVFAEESNQDMITMGTFLHSLLIKKLQINKDQPSSITQPISDNIRENIKFLFHILRAINPHNTSLIYTALNVEGAITGKYKTANKDHMSKVMQSFTDEFKTFATNEYPASCLVTLHQYRTTLLCTPIKDYNFKELFNYIKSIPNLSKTFKQKDMTDSFVLAKMFDVIADIEALVYDSLVRECSLATARYAYQLTTNLINCTLTLITNLEHLKYSVTNTTDSRFFHYFLAMIRIRIDTSIALGIDPKHDLNFLQQLTCATPQSLDHLANTLRLEDYYKLTTINNEKKSSSVEAVIQTTVSSSQPTKSKEPTQATKSASKQNNETSAATKEKENKAKIDFATVHLNNAITAAKESYAAAIHSFKATIETLNSVSTPDNNVRLLKIYTATLLSNCYTEEDDYKRAEGEMLRIQELSNALKPDSDLPPESKQQLQDLSMLLRDVYQKKVHNQPLDSNMSHISKEYEQMTNHDSENLVDKAIVALSAALKKTTAKKVVAAKQEVSSSSSISSSIPSAPNNSIKDKPKDAIKAKKALKDEAKTCSPAKIAQAFKEAQANNPAQPLNKSENTSSSKTTIKTSSANNVSQPAIPAADTKANSETNLAASENKTDKAAENKALSKRKLIEIHPILQDISMYSEATQKYLRDLIENGITIRQQMLELKLSPEEAELFQDLDCPLSLEPFAIPVKLNNQYYELEKLMELKIVGVVAPNMPLGLRKDPGSEHKFTTFEIGPPFGLMTAFQDTLKKLNQRRLADASKNAVSLAIAKPSAKEPSVNIQSSASTQPLADTQSTLDIESSSTIKPPSPRTTK